MKRICNCFSFNTDRSSRLQMFFKIGVLKNFSNFTGKQLVLEFKKGLQHRCFPVKFAEFLKAPFLQNTSGDCFCTDIIETHFPQCILWIHLETKKTKRFLMFSVADEKKILERNGLASISIKFLYSGSVLYNKCS